LKRSNYTFYLWKEILKISFCGSMEEMPPFLYFEPELYYI
jgi:hypothetical protein